MDRTEGWPRPPQNLTRNGLLIVLKNHVRNSYLNVTKDSIQITEVDDVRSPRSSRPVGWVCAHGPSCRGPAPPSVPAHRNRS